MTRMKFSLIMFLNAVLTVVMLIMIISDAKAAPSDGIRPKQEIVAAGSPFSAVADRPRRSTPDALTH